MKDLPRSQIMRGRPHVRVVGVNQIVAATVAEEAARNACAGVSVLHGVVKKLDLTVWNAGLSQQCVGRCESQREREKESREGTL